MRVALGMVALALWVGAVGRALAQDAPAADDPSRPYISEVSPVAGPGAPAWVEIVVGRVGSGTVPDAEERVFLPLVGGESGNAAAAASAPDNIHGWHLRDGDGNDYDIPFAVGNVPQGTVLLVIYDGTGPAGNDLDASDKRVTLHTPPGLTNPFEAAGDQLGLYDDGNALVDFVAWGQPAGDDDNAAAAAGLWANETFVIYDGGFGAGQIDAPQAPGQSIGIWQPAPTEAPRNWVAYSAQNSTPGTLNPPPAPINTTLPAVQIVSIVPPQAAAAFAEGSAERDALAASTHVNLAWSGMDPSLTYEVQVGGDDLLIGGTTTFETPIPGLTVQITDGTHYWRVRSKDAFGNRSAWLGPFQIDVVNLGNFSGLGTIKALLKANEYKIQHKDSTMLDIGGGPNNIVGANNPGNRRYPADRRWDGEHVDANGVPRFGWNGMDNWYCVRASTAMINDYFGGNLTQDRISYYHFKELAETVPGPEGDLGFGQGIGNYTRQEQVLSWALGGAAVTPILYCPNPGTAGYTCPNPAGAPMTFADIKTYIDAGRPFMSINLNNAHARVVDGYWEISPNSRWVHLIDPVPADTGACPTCTNAQWIAYSTFAMNHERAILPPASVPSPRLNEASLSQDNDGDGISNFDETLRFGTNPNNADTDGDWVNDKNDIAEYIFNVSAVGNYVYTPGMAPKTSDFDNDGKRKELDPDNDNDGSLDGCEDLNQDGEFDGLPETNNFLALGGQVCQPRFAILDPIVGQAKNAGDPNNPDKVLVRLKMALPPALTPKPAFALNQFAATIGGQPAPAISGAQVGQEYWLLVQAPVQPASAFYTLTVAFDGTPTGHNDQSDSEANSVFYIPRPRVDTLVVLDRSGSMLDAGKLTSAKNAARLYIDQWAVNDRVGVVTFGDTATTPMALTPVLTGTQVLTDAKNTINAAVGGGQTAMGPGLLAGQTQLTTNGDATHQWSLMLLTDGMENVDPKWPSAQVSGVIIPSQTVVHTVGIGQPNDVWFAQLAAIAGSTGGTFAAVDDPSLAAAQVAAMDEAAAVSAFPASTANRLADGYKWAAEQTLLEQRIYEAAGTLNRPTAPSATHRFHVGDVPVLVLTMNMDVAKGPRVRVFDGNGAEVLPGPGVTRRTDPTHDQWRIASPAPGLWSVQVQSASGEGSSEYLFVAAAQTPLTLNLVAGQPVFATNGAAGPIAAVPLAAFLATNVPVKGAQVAVEVKINAGAPLTLSLLDDGAHGDGASGDGIYGGTLLLPYQGPYVVKARATVGPTTTPAFPAATYRHAQVVVQP